MQRLSMLLGILVVLLAGCGDGDSPKAQEKTDGQQQQSALYKSDQLEITNGEGWTKKEEIEEPFNIRFENDNATVIISEISNKKSVDEIKDELIQSAGEVTILNEGEDFVSFQTNRKESIRSDVAIERTNSESRVIIFMTPTAEYENNKEKFDTFKENIHFK